MAEKKAVAAKKTTARLTTKAPATKQVAPGDSYVCEVCGLAVTVDESCGCVAACDIVCCGEPMKARRPRAKAKAAAK